jgi:signal transduction histidine kinase
MKPRENPDALTRRDIAALLAIFGGLSVLQFFYKYLDFVTRGGYVNPLVPFLEELTGVYGALVLYLVLGRPAALRFRVDRLPWTRWLPIHVGVLLLFSALHTSWNWGTRLVLFYVCGLGRYDYGIMRVRYFMEFPVDVTAYAMLLTITVSLERMREARQRELGIARLESDLAKAQLEALSLQLQPHFLFNALNAVSAAIYDDPRKADIMLGRVADFLRHLRSAAQEVALQQELEMLKLYLHIMQARFEENLQVSWNVAPALGDRGVPQLILQPIVENAIRYGVEPGTSQVRVEVGASVQNGTLTLTVRDRGTGIRGRSEAGIGLANTRARLERLYGETARLTIENALGGGAEVRIDLPNHPAPLGQNELQPRAELA